MAGGLMLTLKITFFLVLMPILCFGYGPPGFLPDGQRPRILLSSTELSALNAKQAASDADWVALEAWCDAHIGDTGYSSGDVNWQGYRGSAYYTHLLNYALAYQVLKDDNPAKALSYAQRVRSLLIDGILIGFKSGEENNGLGLLRCGESSDRTINMAEGAALGISTASYKLGYASRNLAAVPLAYDWIHESGVLSPQDKTNLTAMMFRWFDWIRGVRSTYNNGVLANGIRYHEDRSGNCTGTDNCTAATGAATLGYSYGNMMDNFMGGHAILINLIPLAVYGDNPSAATYLAASTDLITNTIKDQLSNDLKLSGGDSTEGWNYGSSFFRTALGLYGHYTATGENVFSGFNWPVTLVEAMLHRSQSDLLNVPIYGDWTGIPLGANREYLALPLVGISQRIAPNDNISKVGQFLLQNAPFPASNANLWERVFYRSSTFPSATPSTLPLAYRATGTGLVNSRSSWTNDASAVHFSIRLEGKKNAGHEGYDEGAIYLMRGADRLLSSQAMSGGSTASSTVVFNNNSHHAMSPDLTKTAIDRYENTAGYLYVSGDITNAWKRQWNADRALLVRRSALHLRPGFILMYDVNRSNSSLGNLKEWYTQYESDPTISADTITAIKGGSKAFIKTLYPTGGTFTKSAPATGYWRVKYTPAVTQEYDQFLHVIEATGKNQSAMTKTVRIDASTGNMRGAYIFDPANPDNNWVAMFTADQTGALVNDTVQYELPIHEEFARKARYPRHIIVDLLPSSDYTFISPKSKNDEQIYTLKPGSFPAEGSIFRSTSQGVVFVDKVGPARDKP